MTLKLSYPYGKNYINVLKYVAKCTFYSPCIFVGNVFGLPVAFATIADI